MSFNLHWYKPPTERKPLGSSYHPLKGILASAYGVYDGSCKEEFTLNESDVPYLRGLADAGIEDAARLLADLIKYKSLEVDIS